MEFNEYPSPLIYDAIRQVLKRHPYGILNGQLVLELVGMGHDVFSQKDIEICMNMLGAKPLLGMDAGWKI